MITLQHLFLFISSFLFFFPLLKDSLLESLFCLHFFVRESCESSDRSTKKTCNPSIPLGNEKSILERGNKKKNEKMEETRIIFNGKMINLLSCFCFLFLLLLLLYKINKYLEFSQETQMLNPEAEKQNLNSFLMMPVQRVSRKAYLKQESEEGM